MPLCGAPSAPTPPSEEDKRVFTPIAKKYIGEQTGSEPSDIKITEVSRQLVNGVNHFLKVEHGDAVWHIRVHEALPCYGAEVKVHSHKVAAPGDPLKYF